jgi:hypothetical protein
MDWYEMMKTLSRLFSQKQDPNRVSPVDKPRLDLLEKDEVKTKRPSMWNIVFYNDDYTPMDFVEFVLKTIFHMSTLDALALTLAAQTFSRLAVSPGSEPRSPSHGASRKRRRARKDLSADCWSR